MATVKTRREIERLELPVHRVPGEIAGDPVATAGAHGAEFGWRRGQCGREPGAEIGPRHAPPGLFAGQFPPRRGVGHQRRYTADSLAATAADAGLSVGRSTYFFSWLAPAALLLRNRGIRNYEPVAGDSATMSVVRWSIGLVCRLERAVARRVRLPFGTSLWAQFRPHQSDT